MYLINLHPYASQIANGIKGDHEIYTCDRLTFAIGSTGWSFTVNTHDEIVVNGPGRCQPFGRHHRVALNFLNNHLP